MEIEDNKEYLENMVVAGAKPFVVVGIPAFNEEQSIAKVVLRSQKFADAVVVCDDGSKDMTAKIAQRLGADVVRHDNNLGYGAALDSLFRRSLELGADVLVTLDGDGQHDPSEVPLIVQPIVDGKADLVIGSRFLKGAENEEMPLYRRLGAKTISKLTQLSTRTSKGVVDAQSGFRAYNKGALERMNLVEAGMGASVEILREARRKNLKVCEVSCTCKYKNGKVANSTEHPVRHGVGVVMSLLRLIVEEKPLMMLGIPGVLFLTAGTIFGVWMLQIYAVNHQITTNIALASLSFIVIGFFMLSTGITLYAISRLSRKLNGNR